MCYQFYVPQHQDIDFLDEILDYLESRNMLVKTGAVTPGDVAAVIANSREQRPRPFGMLWGYHLSNGELVYNARSETASEKALFADGMRQRRCLIPADSYYEWQKTEQGKQKYEIAPSDANGFLLAGIYRIEQGSPVFSILTKAPVESIAFIHNRMPVILPNDAMRDWLNPRFDGIDLLRSSLGNMRFDQV